MKSKRFSKADILDSLEDRSEISMEAFFQSVLASAPNGILCFEATKHDSQSGVDFRCVFVNDIGLKALALTSRELIDQKISGIQLFESGAFADRLREVMDTGRLTTFEQHFEHIDRHFRMTAVKAAHGVTVNMQDISALREVQQEMHTEEKKYRRLFDESIDAICLVDDKFAIIEANSSCLQMLQFDWSDLQCLQLPELAADTGAFEVFQKTLATKGKAEEFEVPFRTKSGKSKPALLNGIVIKDDLGHPMYLVVIRDLTRRKQTERDLLRAEKLSMTGKIARTIAHEVRNPLTNLTLVVDQLKEEVAESAADPADTETYFEIISRNIDRIGKLITDLLNSSKPKELNLVEQSFNKVVMQALDLVRDRIMLRDMRLQVSLTEEPDEVPLDADQFKVAILNLLINAIEAMEEGKGQLSITTRIIDEKIQLSIRDNGVGISEEHFNRLFEPYFTGKKQGTGLGLTTVQNIIHSHKGTIRVDSELGEGTTFFVSFPIASV